MGKNFRVTRFFALLSVLAMVLCLAACGGEDSAQGDSADDSQSGDKKMLYSIGAGSPGGAQQVYTGACAALVSKYADIVELVPETSGSGGAEADLMVMLQGEAELSYVSNAPASELYNSTNPELRALWGALPQEFIIVTNDPEVNDITDLAGKVVAIGPAGGTPETSSREIFSALNIDAELVAMQWADCFTSLAEGKVDAVTGACGNPTSALLEAETMFDCHWVSLTEEQIDIIMNTYSHFSPVSMPTSYYADLTDEMGNDGTYDTVGVWMCVYSREDVDDEAIYQIVKAILSHQDELVASSNASAAYTTNESFVNANVPLHSGAIRYYQEVGVDIPDEMIVD